MANEPIELKVGDVVRLKAGGPRMTVEAIHSEGTVGCVWFQASFIGHDADGDPEWLYHDVARATFRPASITFVE
jgi:uncharacterized protein YodC (DUF2158 family)